MKVRNFSRSVGSANQPGSAMQRQGGAVAYPNFPDVLPIPCESEDGFGIRRFLAPVIQGPANAPIKIMT